MHFILWGRATGRSAYTPITVYNSILHFSFSRQNIGAPGGPCVGNFLIPFARIREDIGAGLFAALGRVDLDHAHPFCR